MIPTAKKRSTAIALDASSSNDILSPMAWAMMVTVTMIQKPTVVPILKNIPSMLYPNIAPLPANLRIDMRTKVKTYTEKIIFPNWKELSTHSATLMSP